MFFTVRALDPQTGLVNLRARFYDPALGRFLTPDPSGVRGGINAYAYVENNPVAYTDPLGLLSIASLKARASSAWNTYVAEPVKSTISDVGDMIDRHLPSPVAGTINGLAAIHPGSILLGRGSTSENYEQFKAT